MPETTDRPVPPPRPEPPKPPRPPLNCPEITQEFKAIRASHPQVPAAAWAGIWTLITHGECGPEPS